jgi:uncharacterized protein YuzE
MEKIKGKILFDYDNISDVLYTYIDKPRPAATIEPESGIVVRYDPKTQEIVGITIIDYMKRIKCGKLDKIPFFEDVEFPIYP